jgi:hypothetical protein
MRCHEVDDVDSGGGTVPGELRRWYSSRGGDEFRCQSPVCHEGSLHSVPGKSSPDRCPAKPSRGASFRAVSYPRAPETATPAPVRRSSKMDKRSSEVPVRHDIRKKDSFDLPGMRVHSYTLPPRFPIRRRSDECGPDTNEPSELVVKRDCWSDSLREPVRDRTINCLVSQDGMSEDPREVLVQVAPGVRVPLRSGSETWQAIIDDFYVPSACLGCSTTLFVIQDAAYVLCPCCRSISPMEGQFVNLFAAGAGMGFTFDDLARWQDDIHQDAR